MSSAETSGQNVCRKCRIKSPPGNSARSYLKTCMRSAIVAKPSSGARYSTGASGRDAMVRLQDLLRRGEVEVGGLAQIGHDLDLVGQRPQRRRQLRAPLRAGALEQALARHQERLRPVPRDLRRGCRRSICSKSRATRSGFSSVARQEVAGQLLRRHDRGGQEIVVVEGPLAGRIEIALLEEPALQLLEAALERGRPGLGHAHMQDEPHPRALLSIRPLPLAKRAARGKPAIRGPARRG